MSFLNRIHREIVASRDTLYHYMTMGDFLYFVDDWKLRGTQYPEGPPGWGENHQEFISFSRNPRMFMEDTRHSSGEVFRFNPETEDLEEDDDAEQDSHSPVYNVRLTIDGRKLDHKYKMQPYSDNPDNPAEYKQEAEEVLKLPKGEWNLDIEPYVKAIEYYEPPQNPNYNELVTRPVADYLKSKGVPLKKVSKF